MRISFCVGLDCFFLEMRLWSGKVVTLPLPVSALQPMPRRPPLPLDLEERVAVGSRPNGSRKRLPCNKGRDVANPYVIPVHRIGRRVNSVKSWREVEPLT
jgi:hypothetical protein